MDELYKKYGMLMVNLEILNGQIGECKRAIAEGLQKQNSFQGEQLKPVEVKSSPSDRERLAETKSE